MRGVLRAPASLLQDAYDGTADVSQWEAIGRSDQEMVVALVARNADLFTSNPGGLQGYGQCFPFSASFTLGEHGFAEGLLAAVPWALTGEPILAYNFMLWIGYFLSGFGMFLLVRHFTGDNRAGLLGGLFLQWLPGRLVDGGHPFLHAEFWLPFALLFLHRLFVTGRVRAAVGVAFFLCMQALESFYLILGVIPVILVYVPFLFWRHATYRWKALALSLAAGLCVALLGSWVLLPYLETREVWSLLSDRDGVLLPILGFMPGKLLFPGWIFFGLIVVGLLDRLRGPRSCDGEDPRMAMLLAVGIILSSSTYGLRVPGTAVAIPSIIKLLSGVVPGLDAVRALGVMSNIIWVPLALIAGYGARAVLDVFGSRGQQVLFVSLLLGVAGIRFWPALSIANFGRPLLVEARNVRPPEADIALLRSQPISALLHLPAFSARPTAKSSMELLLGSFSPSPNTSCYNSFGSPLGGQIVGLARRLPESGASEALAALGIDTVLFHKNARMPSWRVTPERQATFAERHANAQERFDGMLLESPEARERLVRFGETEGLVGYRLQGRLPTTSSTKTLIGTHNILQVWKEGKTQKVVFWIRNRGEEVYLDPEPRGFREGSVMWVDEKGAPISRVPVKFLMPIALGPGGLQRLFLGIEPPLGDGVHLGYLSLAEGKWKAIARARVRRGR